jgi:hypothetical protein
VVAEPTVVTWVFLAAAFSAVWPSGGVISGELCGTVSETF